MDKVGIDVPFGWPDAFVAAVGAHHVRRRWPNVSDKQLQFRATDRAVREHPSVRRWPLSVASDRIAITTMRAAKLFSMLAARGAPVARDGSGKIIEVYPAAALRIWGFNAAGYKRKENRAARLDLLKDILAKTANWLKVPDGVRALCEASDDALDALVAGLVARASACGSCDDIPPETARAGHA